MDIGATNLFAELGLVAQPDKKSNNELGQQDFLRLMLAQVQNQNPLEPQSNGEFLAQLAQFGVVDGIQKMNVGFEDLSDRLAGEQTLAAAQLLGREVLVPGNLRQTGSGLSGVVKLPQPAERVDIEISDARGVTVYRATLDGRNGGELAFAWNGRDADGELLPAGQYSVSARARMGSRTESLDTLLSAPVNGVTRDGGQVRLELDGLSPARLSDVRRIT